MEDQSSLSLTSSVTMPTHTPAPTPTITRDDIVILVMGKIGSGRSNFIKKLAEMQPEEGTENLSSHTENVCAYECYHSGQRFILVDTPGLNNGELLQGAAFTAIATWLKIAYASSPTNGRTTPEEPVKLTGVIHTHSITDSSMSGADARSFKLLHDLCGDRAADRVRLVTTMWDVADESEAVKVEDALKTHWQPLIDTGARPKRFDNTSERAWIIAEELENTKKALLVQEELDTGTRLKDTSAGKHLRPEEWVAP
ncbi:hypothetical protein EDD16DRAFT_1834368 [Pisolithus croceorrhizus]|nr:hypothetical protein EDD16DRAFT_1834368 [Pisolithus croceorrhizus]